MSAVELRWASPDDRDAVYDICLRTGDAGADASDRLRHGELYGHLYAGQYLALEPHLALVASLDGTVQGYALAALDTAAFERRLENDWWPPLRRAYPLPGDGTELDRQFVARLHAPAVTPAAVTSRYPSHLHIDLLPDLQGRGLGRRMIETLLARLAELGSTGVHLGVDTRNVHAQGFYEHLGFTRHHADGVVLFARRLSPVSAPST